MDCVITENDFEVFGEYGEYEEMELETPSSPFNYHDITKDDMNNGEGLRVVLWMSGCNHRCPGCQNPETWDAASGIAYTEETEMELFDDLSKEWIDGITFSGGDPLFPKNRGPVRDIIEKLKKKYPEKTVWLYTGYSLKYSEYGWYFEDESPWLMEHDRFAIDWLDQIDVLVDGPFNLNIRKVDVADKKDPYWCGSSNQRVIDVKATLRSGNIALYETA